MNKYFILLIITFCLFLLPKSVLAAIPAFPGAEGFGAQTVGGRGGRIYEITNLNDSGTGSLRECVSASGARTCVFKVAGLINLTSALTISNPYLTIAGQTAPGGGITLKNINGGSGIHVTGHDVIIRYITSRPGPGGQNEAITISNNSAAYNVIIDHCSLSWATDEVMSTWYDTHNVSVQWNIISEGLHCSTHRDGCHSKGAMIGGYKNNDAGDGIGAYDISFHHNLLASHDDRGPLIKTGGLVDVVNNITYNMGGIMSHVFVSSPGLNGIIPVNFVGNYYKSGPSSPSGKYEIGCYYEGDKNATAHIYLKGNIGPHRTSNTQPETLVFKPDSVHYSLVTTRFSAPTITETDAFTAYDQVLANAGANQGINCDGSFFSRRDSIDNRIVNDVKNKTGEIIDDPSEVGGWIIPAAGTFCEDSDNDGMPDNWENAKFGNLTTATNITDYDKDGYTDLEEFLDGTNPKDGSPSPTLAPSCPLALSGDLDCSRKVNALDLVLLISHWGQNYPAGDLNNSGTVDAGDMKILLDNWGKSG